MCQAGRAHGSAPALGAGVGEGARCAEKKNAASPTGRPPRSLPAKFHPPRAVWPCRREDEGRRESCPAPSKRRARARPVGEGEGGNTLFQPALSQRFAPLPRARRPSLSHPFSPHNILTFTASAASWAGPAGGEMGNWGENTVRHACHPDADRLLAFAPRLFDRTPPPPLAPTRPSTPPPSSPLSVHSPWRPARAGGGGGDGASAVRASAAAAGSGPIRARGCFFWGHTKTAATPRAQCGAVRVTTWPWPASVGGGGGEGGEVWRAHGREKESAECAGRRRSVLVSRRASTPRHRAAAAVDRGLPLPKRCVLINFHCRGAAKRVKWRGSWEKKVSNITDRTKRRNALTPEAARKSHPPLTPPTRRLRHPPESPPPSPPFNAAR